MVDAKKDLFGYRYYNWTPNKRLLFEWWTLNSIDFSSPTTELLGAEENYKAETVAWNRWRIWVWTPSVQPCPASEQTLQIAAELGLLVQKKPLTWYGGKKQYDYGRFCKDATRPDAKKGEKWSDFDLRTMVERAKNNPAIVMWSYPGNEIRWSGQETRSLATVKRLVQVIKAVDKTRYVTMGADKFLWWW